ncbi:S1/P1 Nuclease [Apiospora marii]|uniref:S1/P1 Nuclease n=1 Tax=Apiospora marii TaxID=335849 RepID=A0ABR1RD21_9PEZI
MRVSIAAGLLMLFPTAECWGSLGHTTIGYLASDLVQDSTASYFKKLLKNDTEHYMAGIATWADQIRYTKWGRFSKDFHFIDAKDEPPTYCGVDFERDCKEDGCVVSAIKNYTDQLLDVNLVFYRRNQAAKFLVHFVGDIHQPLHAENVAQGGNGIPVKWENSDANVSLHHVWDSAIPEKMLGQHGLYPAAKQWAGNLSLEIETGKYSSMRQSWEGGMHLEDPVKTAMIWAMLPEGLAIAGQELSGEYFERAAPVVEIQVARAGYRLAR